MTTSKNCIHCGVALTPGGMGAGGNWSPSRQRRGEYCCTSCHSITANSPLRKEALREYGSMMDRPTTPTIDEVQTDWRDAQIDKTVALASGRYREVDEGYERVQCGYVYQMRQRDVLYLSKVGFSGDPEARLKAPNTFLEEHREFIIVKAWPVKDKAKAEAFVHRRLADRRVSKKELFGGHYSTITDLIDVAMMEYYDGEV